MVFKKITPIFCFVLLSAAAFSQTYKSPQNALLDAEQTMNAVYKEVIVAYSKSPLFISNLKTAQKAWLTSRDADFLMKFPQANSNNAQALYGSIFAECKANFYKEYVDKRIIFLRQWLKSSKTKNQECTGTIHDFVNKN